MNYEIEYLSADELEEQKQASAEIEKLSQRPQSYHIVTYGCQMNAHDSEILSGMLEEMGMHAVAERTEADLVIFNTCCIRDNAERRALGNIIWLKQLKKTKPDLIIGVCGCMVQQPHTAEQIVKQYPFIDFAFGTHNMYQLPALLLKVVKERRQTICITDRETLIAEGLPVKRMYKHHAYITIMYGCNNFCSYCVVPYVRGRERSRKSCDILREAEVLLKDGVQEIMLLGQNVNSYGSEASGDSFPKLLRDLDRMGIPRIRFMTSHPKDLSDELIDAMAAGKHICHHLHLPVQSGNTEILSRMNRRYTRADYLSRVTALRSAIPDIGLTTDLIVGFPGETEEQFMDTCSLVDEVGYDAAFTFIYSPRKGTVAAKMPDQIAPDIATKRITTLIQHVEAGTTAVYQKLIGQYEEVLVEGVSKRNDNEVSGKGGRNITISFEGNENDIGKIIPVHITSAAVNTLRAERIER